MAETEDGRRCGFVALVGAPNAGKSTLLNQMVGAKVSIVTPKVQTTRTRITGIAIEGKTQLVFVDTPGIFTKTKRRLERAMVASAWAGAADADQVVVVVDGTKKGIGDDVRRILDGLAEAKRPAILALNKVDLIKRPELLPRASQLNHLIESPDFKDFLAAAPQAARLLRPLCHILGIAPHLALPIRPRPPRIRPPHPAPQPPAPPSPHELWRRTHRRGLPPPLIPTRLRSKTRI